MNKPIYIIIHCSATREDKDFTEKQINDSHVARGFGKWGYHYYIRKDGRVIPMRAENEIGAHDNFIVPGMKISYNRCSIGICYEGDWIKTARQRIPGRTHRRKLCASSFRTFVIATTLLISSDIAIPVRTRAGTASSKNASG